MLEEVRDWQSRPLEWLYPIALLGALRVKVRDEGLVRSKAIYVALGISAEFSDKGLMSCRDLHLTEGLITDVGNKGF